MDIYLRVRQAHFQDGLSGREIARQFGISRDNVRKMLLYPEPPGYRWKAPIRRPKLDGFTDQIDQWLLEDKGVARKQRHTAKRVFERLRDERGFEGGYTIVKDYIRAKKQGGQEMFVPLSHRPGNRVIIHSDQGSQYTSQEWLSFLKDHNLEPSMSRRGNCYDNAVAESFFHLLKTERIRRKIYKTRALACQDIFDYIELFYNPKRRHANNGMLSPVEFEKAEKMK